jgi:uncharacterized protein (TIGR02449 family)
MDEDLQALALRIDRLIEGMQQLADSNRALRAQLTQAQARQHALEQRMEQARAKVKSALDRLPGDESLGIDDHEAAH